MVQPGWSRMQRRAESTRHQVPSSGRARVNLLAGVFVACGSFSAAAIAHTEFLAYERGEGSGAVMPAPVIHLYELVGRVWTTAAFVAFGVAMLTVGVVAWSRERAKCRRQTRP